jgi:20S proteasome subunit beta 7
MVTGGSVVAIKYAGGILVAADTLAAFGSLARFEGVVRMKAVGVKQDSLIAAGGDISDFQQIIKDVEAAADEEYALDDGASMSASGMHHWLTRIMYNRRSKMDPLWNSIIVCGYRDGKGYLGTTDLYGTMYEDNFIATGLGAHMALPIMRKTWKEDLTEAEARKILVDCMRVLFYRDTRASVSLTIGKVCAEGAAVEEPMVIDTKWDYPAFIKGGGHRGDGSW